MALVKPRSILIDRMRHHTPHASDLRSGKAAPERIREQRRTQTTSAPCRINAKPPNKQ
jgi:hypothetical protein